MDTLKDYAQQEVIYEGLETRVIRAVHAQTGTRVAIKMAAAASPSPRVIGRLAHEQRMLQKLSTIPGVIRSLSPESQEVTSMLLLEDPGYNSLDRMLSGNRRIPLDVGLRLGARIARVLHQVHAAGVMHKDIKPQNILVSPDFVDIRLLDFGIASWLAQEATEASIPEALEGTLSYISPEQTGRTARVLDARTDLYSLGISLFQMLSGQLPYPEVDPLAVVHAHLAKTPPRLDTLSPDIPQAVALIIAKLLEKDPEQRYQTAQGAAEDLEYALVAITERGSVEPFPLGKKDFSLKLRLPQVLVGRENEVEQLRGSFKRAAKKGVELVLVAGPSGIGKTALVRTVYKHIAKAGRGLLISGKHDQLARSTPYGAMAQAFGDLMRQWLSSSESVLKSWQDRIRKDVGENARLIADIVPELDLVMGELPPLPPVQGDQVLNRLKLTWLNFVRTVTEPSAPLVMFLDDLQWADSATLVMLQTLLTDVDRSSLLIIGAYRDNETPPEHPLWKLVGEVEKSGAQVTRLQVEPLNETQVQKWLARTLESEIPRVESFARVLWQKTRGNPFFLEQLLLSLHRHKQVVRDAATGQWQWDQEKLEHAQVTDNVVALLLDKVRELPEATQEILGLAACAGHQFELQELERLSGWNRARVTEALGPALQEELVVPVDGSYRMAQALGTQGQGELNAAYRFLHDRVQQASYERIGEDKRALAHLEIGRRLWARYRASGGTVQELLDVTRQMNQGAVHIESAEERVELAKLNLKAAQAAKAASSHQLMISLLEMALSLLGPMAWMENPALAGELSIERIEGSFLIRDLADVESRAQMLLSLPVPRIARLAAYELRVRSAMAGGQFPRARDLALESLKEVGIEYPATEQERAPVLMGGAGELDHWFAQNPNAFDEMPPDFSIENILIDATMGQLGLSLAGLSEPMGAGVVIVRGIQEARRRNAITPITPFMIANFASIWSLATGQYLRGSDWVAPSERAARRVGCPMLSEVLANKGGYWVYLRPVDEVEAIYEESIGFGTKTGSFQGQSWGLLNDLFYYRLWRGQPLWQVDAQVKRCWGMVMRAWDAWGRDAYQAGAALLKVLMNPAHVEILRSKDPISPSSETLLQAGDGFIAENVRIVETLVFLLVGNNELAFSRIRDAEKNSSVIFGTAPASDIPFYMALAAAHCHPGEAINETPESLRAIVKGGLDRLTYFASGCAENFLHKQKLIEAELARIDGRTEEAMAKYEEAIDYARQQRFFHVEALAAQYCAEFHLAAGRQRLGKLFLGETYEACARWGATALTAILETKYPNLRKSGVSIDPQGRTISKTTGTLSGATDTGENVQLDVSTAIRAAQTLAGELDPDRVVGRLMQLVLENAGAQRGALLLPQGSELVLISRLSVEDGRVATGLSEPLSSARGLAGAAVQYAVRTRESLVLQDTQTDTRFASEPHFREQGVRSVLVIPLLHQGRLGGVLYLEHALPAAFPASRVALLGVLAAQGAIALENAQLYTDLQRLNQNLEAQVAARTADLQKALSELWSEMDLAKKIQTVLLPPDGNYRGYEIAALMKPADNVGGDYYDVIEAGDELWVLIGDVSGHGISAGLIMMMVQVAVRTLVGKEVKGEALTPSRLLGYVNAAVRPNLGRIGRGQYMTITAFRIKGGEVQFAGLHLDPLVYRAAEKKVERLESLGLWLGIVDDMDLMCDDQTVQLAPGDVLLLYTDGLVESHRDGELTGMNPPIECLAKEGLAGTDCQKLVERVFGVLDGAVRDDDVTIMALRRKLEETSSSA